MTDKYADAVFSVIRSKRQSDEIARQAFDQFIADVRQRERLEMRHEMYIQAARLCTSDAILRKRASEEAPRPQPVASRS